MKTEQHSHKLPHVKYVYLYLSWPNSTLAFLYERILKCHHSLKKDHLKKVIYNFHIKIYFITIFFAPSEWYMMSQKESFGTSFGINQKFF